MIDLTDLPVDRRASVALDAITTSRQQWNRQHRRPPAMTAREAVAAMWFESLLIWTAGANVRAGVDLTDADFDRIGLAMQRIEAIREEVLDDRH